MFFEKIIKALNAAEIEFVVVGGYAVALHGAVRGTVDLDLALKWNQQNVVNCEKALNEIGFISKIPVNAKDIFSFRDEYIKNKNLVAWNFYNPSNPAELVDVIITYNLAKKDIQYKKFKNYQIPVLSKKALVVMKKQSARPQDLLDAEALEKIK